jgi:hypothetical protein
MKSPKLLPIYEMGTMLDSLLKAIDDPYHNIVNEELEQLVENRVIRKLSERMPWIIDELILSYNSEVYFATGS